MPPPPDPVAVFLNVPYDREFSSLYVAYIVGLFQLGLVPHLASEIPGGDRRLSRIFNLIQSCRYSIHDLSRVEVSDPPTPVPRFNMPLELGMTITWQELNHKLHTWFVFESESHRLLKSASDLNGTDAYIHGGTPEGILRELRNAFFRDTIPSVPDMFGVFRFVNSFLDTILLRNGTSNPFDRTVFMELCRLSNYLTQVSRPAKPKA